MGATNSRKGAKGGKPKKETVRGMLSKKFASRQTKKKRSLPLVSSVHLLKGGRNAVSRCFNVAIGTLEMVEDEQIVSVIRRVDKKG